MRYNNDPVVIIEWWEVDCGDLGIHRFTSKQLDDLMQAEKRQVRFVKINDILINIAFIRGAKKIIKKYQSKDLEFKTIDKRDIAYITCDKRPKQLQESTKFYTDELGNKIIV